MRAPDFLYRFAHPKDVTGLSIELVVFQTRLFTSATTISLSITNIPSDRVLVLTNGSLLGNPMLAQSCIQLDLSGFSPSGIAVEIAQVFPVAAIDVIQTLNWTGEIWLLGRGEGVETVRGSAVFSLATASNLLEVNLYGYVIPRGNVAIF